MKRILAGVLTVVGIIAAAVLAGVAIAIERLTEVE